mgnify:CR=1 FL=1
MSKWKWIAQDADGKVYKHDHYLPDPDSENFKTPGLFKRVYKGKQNPNFKETLINLETEDYEINDGILTRIPRKTELDKLIANVKKIDKKAAKWMNKNRCKLEDVYYLGACFDWDDCEKYDWCYIHNELIKLEQEPKPAKETLKYRVALYNNRGTNFLMFSITQDDAESSEKYHLFVRWLTDWIEVEV